MISPDFFFRLSTQMDSLQFPLPDSSRHSRSLCRFLCSIWRARFSFSRRCSAEGSDSQSQVHSSSRAISPFASCPFSLTRRGYTSLQGNAFNTSTIGHIPQNPKYKGWYCGNKTQSLDYRKKTVFLDESEWVSYPDPISQPLFRRRYGIKPTLFLSREAPAQKPTAWGIKAGIRTAARLSAESMGHRFIVGCDSGGAVSKAGEAPKADHPFGDRFHHGHAARRRSFRQNSTVGSTNTTAGG